MKLTNIRIYNLFGLEQNNFDIHLNAKDGISLLYGINGIGKTTIIKLIKACLDCDFRILKIKKFKTIEISFEDGSIIKVFRDDDFEPGMDIPNCWIGLMGFEDYPIRYEYTDTKNRSYIFSFPLKIADAIDDIDDNRIINEETTFSDNDFHYFTKEGQYNYNKIKDILSKITNVHTIYATKEHSSGYNSMYDIVYSENDEILYFKRDQLLKLKKDIQNMLEIIDEFPKEDIKWYEKAQFDLIPITIPFIDRLEHNAAFIKDNFGDPTYERQLKLLKKIINQNFGLIYKNLDFNEKDGIIFAPVNKNDKPVSYKKLSFGERKLISIFFELILECKNNSIVFIDEPETSLHIDWQKIFVQNIEIVMNEINPNIQIVIMTHSPDIIDKYLLFSNELKSERDNYGNKYFED